MQSEERKRVELMNQLKVDSTLKKDRERKAEQRESAAKTITRDELLYLVCRAAWKYSPINKRKLVNMLYYHGLRSAEELTGIEKELEAKKLIQITGDGTKGLLGTGPTTYKWIGSLNLDNLTKEYLTGILGREIK